MVQRSYASFRFSKFLFLCTLFFVQYLPNVVLPFDSDNNPHLRLISESSEAVVLECTFPFPNIDNHFSDGQEYNQVTVAGLSNLTGSSIPSLPYAGYCLHLSSSFAKVEITDTSTALIPLEKIASRIETVLDGELDDKSSKLLHPFNDNRLIGFYPQRLIEFDYLGSFRENHLWSLRVFPYRYNSTIKQLKIYNRIKIKISIKTDVQEGLRKVQIQPLEKQSLNRLAAVSTTDFKRIPIKTSSLRKGIADIKPKVKLMVQEDGLYKVTGKDLVKADVDIRSIEPRTFGLSNKGNDVAIYVTGWRDGSFDEEDAIEFWGEFNRQTFQHLSADMYRDQYSDINVYWLSWGGEPGLWMAEEQGTVVESSPGKVIRPYYFMSFEHAESDNYYERLSQIQGDVLRDHWFFDSGIASSTKIEYTVHLAHPDVNALVPGRLRLMLGGRTYDTPQPHSVTAFLNSQRVLSGQWQDQNFHYLQTQQEEGFSAHFLTNGKNVLTIVNEVDASEIDYILLNWFEIEYPRLFRAENNELKFGVQENARLGLYEFAVDGFDDPNIDVYKIGTSKILGGREEEYEDYYGFKSNRIVFQDRVSSPSVKYVAVTKDAKKKPVLITRAKQVDLKSATYGADYLIIAHNRFINNDKLSELLHLREDQGLRTAIVSTESIYDDFSYGLLTPYAIKEFLKFAYNNWQEPPLRYALLVGDGSYVRRPTAEGDTLDFVPVFMRQTVKFGAAASDHWYSLISGEDEIPDVCVGRLPVRTNEELDIVINKIIQYETEPPSGAWRNRMLFIGGNGYVFRDQSEGLIATIVPARFDAARLYSLKLGDVDPCFGGTADLLDQFDEGCAVMTFRGHGGGAIWADNSLFRKEDVERIYSRGRLPLVVSLTCFTCSFESPRERASLGEELLLAEEKGAVAMIGASGVGWVWNDYYLFKEMLKLLVTKESKTVGEFMAEGKISYMNNYSDVQVFSNVNQYHLIGDPATRLVLPETEIDIELNNRTPDAGDTLIVSGSFGTGSGAATFDLIDSTKTIVQRISTSLQQGRFEGKLVVPNDYPNGSGFCRAYVSDEMGIEQANAAQSISLLSAVFDSTWSVPAKPSYGDSFHVFADLVIKDRPDSVFCIFFAPQSDTLLMPHVDGTIFRTKEAYGPLERGDYLYYYVEVYRTGKTRGKSKYTSLWITRGSDLTVVADDIKLGGLQSVELQTTVRNIGDEDVRNVVVVYEQFDPETELWKNVGRDTVDVPRQGTTLAGCPFKSEPDTIRIRITVQAPNNITEVNVENNVAEVEITVNKFNLSTILGSTIQGVSNDTLEILPGFACHFSPGVIHENTVLSIEKLDTIQIFEQPDLSVLFGENKTIGFEIALANGSTELLPGRTFTTWIENPYSDSTLTESLEANIFRLDRRTRKWVKLETKIEDGFFIAQSNFLGKLVVLASADKTPPNIEISIAGQPHSLNTFVSKNPEIWVLFQDENGIDVSDQSISIQINGRELKEEEFSFPDSLTDGNAISVRVTPQVSEGDHVLEVSARDCSGNQAKTKSLRFRIVEEFELRVLGNYPNPFSRETTLAYLLTQPADDITVRIFTAAGRLVRKYESHDFLEDANPVGPDYHELTWDGRDSDDNEVANGVYFCKVEAKGPTKTIEKVLKMAKIR